MNFIGKSDPMLYVGCASPALFMVNSDSIQMNLFLLDCPALVLDEFIWMLLDSYHLNQKSSVFMNK